MDARSSVCRAAPDSASAVPRTRSALVAFGNGQNGYHDRQFARPETAAPDIAYRVDSGHDINLRHLAADGVHVLGGFHGINGDKLLFLDNLGAILDAADQSLEDFLGAAESYRRAAGLELPEDMNQAFGVARTPLMLGSSRALGWRAGNVRTVIWCTGYRGSFDWVHLPVFDAQGVQRQRRGVTVGLARILGVLSDGIGQFFHRGGGFLVSARQSHLDDGMPVAWKCY